MIIVTAFVMMLPARSLSFSLHPKMASAAQGRTRQTLCLSRILNRRSLRACQNRPNDLKSRCIQEDTILDVYSNNREHIEVLQLRLGNSDKYPRNKVAVPTVMISAHHPSFHVDPPNHLQRSRPKNSLEHCKSVASGISFENVCLTELVFVK